ncbi:MAG: IgGFc-binding protein [Myxococcales bacterium]|nr:IgGFc-binding protein [Myxococcales bacterium]
MTINPRSPQYLLSTSLAALALVAACNGDDTTGETDSTSGTATATTTASTTATTTATGTATNSTGTDTASGTGTDSDGTSTSTTSGMTTSTSSESTGDTDSSTTDGVTSTSTTTTTGEPPMLHCSGDLKHILNENDQIVDTCPPDQGCLDAMCVPICDAIAQVEGSIGCEFWAPTPPFVFNGNQSASQRGPCFAVFLANTGEDHVNITIERDGQTYDANTYARIPSGIAPNTTYDNLPAEGLPPDEVAILFLSHRPGVKNSTSLECPVPPAVLDDTAVPGSGIGKAFRIVTDRPVRAYDILPYGGASSYLPSATLLFPATSWGTNFVANAPEQGTYQDGRFALVVANEDNTVVKIAPKSNFPGGNGIDPAPANQTTEYTINAGDVLQWSGQNNPMDPTAAIIESDKPIALWTGNKYMRIDSQTSPGGGGGESAHQQIPHVTALGSEYIGAGIVTRLNNLNPESVPYRLVGAVDGTQLTWDPMPAGVPTMINAGQIVDFETTSVFIVSSQDDEHPFLFSQYMAGTQNGFRFGCTNDPDQCPLGDEEWVSLLPPAQFQDRYVFFTDPTYPTTNLVLIRVKGEDDQFADVNIECMPDPVSGWKPVGGDGRFEYAHIDLSRGGQPAPGTQCDTSRHLAESDKLFGIVVWGTDYYSSYGYPGGGDIAGINEIIVPLPQ